MKTVVIGSGSWGTGLAQVLADNHQDVTIWGRDIDEIHDISRYHQNRKYFPTVTLNPDVKATVDFDVVAEADVIVLSIPSIAIEEVCKRISNTITKPVIIVNTAKGFHPITHDRLSNVIRSSIAADKLKSVVSLIGPSHAEEVVVRLLTSISAVSLVEEDAKTIQTLFSNAYLRVYTGSDEIGAELGVALKNVIAVASGVISGLGYGDNTKAALITRGLAEMIRFGTAMGGNFETFMGLAGIGDLIVTCTSEHSRNFQAGKRIGLDNSAAYFWENNTKTVEGVAAAKIVYEVAQELNISMPIIDEVYRVLYEEKEPRQSAKDLMMRDLKEEMDYSSIRRN
ncbi:MAG: NAD(P)H-dependent glycerol-3-phosphate dehydrogenase [Erysipelotrichaceae bacterium]